MPDIKVGDRVIVINNEGNVAGEGTVININDYRDPDTKYAIDADFYKEDYLFVGINNLKLIEQGGKVND